MLVVMAGGMRLVSPIKISGENIFMSSAQSLSSMRVYAQPSFPSHYLANDILFTICYTASPSTSNNKTSLYWQP